MKLSGNLAAGLKVAHFGAGLSGGANIAGIRLHEGMRKLGVDSTFYHGAGKGNDDSLVKKFSQTRFFARNLAAVEDSRVARKWAPNGFVTKPQWIHRTTLESFDVEPDVICLHWVVRWLDVPSFLRSVPKTVPVVWTLHDFIPLTGGCHYPGDCNGFEKTCGNCPQLIKPSPRDMTAKSHAIKKRLYDATNLHFVANSRWTESVAKRSSLLETSGGTLSRISYGLDAAQFFPIEKKLAKQSLNIPADKFVIGFSCLDFHEKRKGAAVLLEALKILPPEKILLLVLGGGSWPSGGEVETVTLGSINEPRLQSVFYSACDVLAMPSQIETFGNIAMEAMACETPVLGFAAGGLLDVVENGVTGLLDEDVGSAKGLSRNLHDLYSDLERRREMGVAGRRRVVSHLSNTRMAEEYLQLFANLKERIGT